MNKTIQDFLGTISSLYQLQAKHLPYDVIEEMAMMSTEDLYKVCTQFVVLQHNVPTEEKMINLEEEELLVLVEEYAQELLKRFKGSSVSSRD